MNFILKTTEKLLIECSLLTLICHKRDGKHSCNGSLALQKGAYIKISVITGIVKIK